MCEITVTYPDAAEPDTVQQIPSEDVQHFIATYNRALHYAMGDRAAVVKIHCNERTKPRYHDHTGSRVCYDEGGWLEYTVVVEWFGGGRFVLGAIQRTVGAASEFHS